ncbi:MAG: GNAT family protein [Planctomycetota bacterium]|nr:GNAT family protein [Planctomycetota bacterium]
METTLSGHVLEGSHVVLEPIGVGHAPVLFAAADPSCVTYHPARPDEWTIQGFARYIDSMTADANRAAYLVRLCEDGTVVGTTSFLDIRPAHRGVEIGATWIGSLWRGTIVNPQMKLLMLELAFERWCAIRVQLKCDARNVQSQRAIERLGARREGVLRQHMVLADGFVRDTVMYSIIASEWPAIRNGLHERIHGLEGQARGVHD